ncbi:hypothetical protein XELAEV_18012973mg, partial [Xenopus laevis]
EEKPILEAKSEPITVNISEKNSENSTSEDEKSIDDQEQEDKLSEDEKNTLSSWPEKTPKEESQEKMRANEFSDNEATSSHSKDIPEFSDEDEPDVDTPASPDSLPHFSEDEEMVTQPKNEEMPVEDKGIENVSEDEAPMHSKEVAESSEEEDVPTKETMDFSEEDVPPLTKDALEFSEDNEPANITKNMTELSEEEDESAIAEKILIGFTEEEETTNLSKNIIEFLEEEDTPSLSKEIMVFSEEEDTPAMPKSIMEFSKEKDSSPPSKNMPKYVEVKKPSALSEDEETTDESNFAHTVGGFPFSEDEAAASGSNDLSETPETGNITANVSDMPDISDDKDGFIGDEEIMKHVRRGPVLHHLITRHNVPSPFICKTCGKNLLWRHISKTIWHPTPYKCHRCCFQTDHPRGFKKHQTHCLRFHKDETEQTVLDFQQNKEEN